MRPKLPILTALLTATLLSLASCERKSSVSAAPRVESPKPPVLPQLSIPPGRQPEDVARFIAGIDGAEGSPFRIYELQVPWILHAKASDQQWAKFERSRLPAMSEFQRRELSGPLVDGSTIFYPFGGPDVLTVATLFPRSRDYILVGLEPPGTLPTFDQVVVSRPLKAQLPNVRRTLNSLLNVSFFVTREMDFQLRGQVFNGVLPVILVQMVRMHYRIHGITYVTFDDKGQIVERPTEEDRGGMVSNRGVAIEFQREGDPVVHRLFYFSLNLATDRLKQNHPFLAFLKSRERMSSFFKSTSYMPHNQGFDLIRNQVLDHSSIVVQDDSGIPFRFFDHSRWRVQLYGGYDKPYGSFRYLQQPDLKTAFDNREEVKKLGFGIGYGFGRIPSNLIVARKKG